MRSYRRLTVLGVFLAAGVGVAISVGSSIVPSKPDAVARDPSAEPNNRTATVREQAAPAPPAAIPTLPPLPDSPDRVAGPIYATPHPALAQNQAGPPKSVLPEEIVKLLMDQQRPSPPAEPIPVPPAQPPTDPAMGPPALPTDQATADSVAGPRRNTICRTPGAQGDHFVINILDADIREVLDLLSREGSLNILASPKVEGKVSATLNDVGIESALAAILKSTGYVAQREGQYIFVGTPEDFVQMARTTDQINTRVYHPNYVTSAELKTLITPILTQGVGIVSVTSESKTGIPKELDDAGGDSYAGGDSLLVRDYETALCEIDQLVAEVDLRPLQVHIEAMILSVKLSDQCKFGVDFQLFRQFDHTKLGWGNIPVNAANQPDLNAIEFDGGLKFGFLDESLGAFLNALEKVGDTNVIATPRLMVVNKHAAVIQIGKEEGYVNTTQTETAATQTVEMLELGTILRIRPFISNDGMIRLEVRPEVSDGNVTVEEGFTLPHKEITQVTTNIMVRDGCTAIIGGLIQDKQQSDRSQIPLLGSLPVIGVAFRQKDEKLDRHELIVLITPNVVREREAYREGATQACEFQRRQAVFAEKMSPIGTRSLARKYVRRAQAAWMEGDRREALRMAELAVHFDPVNREAIELRSDIWLGKPIQTPGAVQPDVLHPTGPLDGPQLPPWILNQLGAPKTPPLGTADPRPAPTGRAELRSPPMNLDPPDTVTILPTPPGQQPPAPVPPSSSPSLP